MEIVEPVFGNIRNARGMDRFTLRGKQKTEGRHNMEELLNDFWWISVFSIPLVAALIWIAKKRVSEDTAPSQWNQMMTIGILSGIAGSLYRSATRAATSWFTFPRILFVLILTGLVGNFLCQMLEHKKKRRSPNQ